MRKAIEYITVSFNRSNKDYKNYKEEYDLLLNYVTDIFINEKLKNNTFFKIDFDETHFVFSFSLNTIFKLSMADIQNIFNKVFNRKNMNIFINNNTRSIDIKV